MQDGAGRWRWCGRMGDNAGSGIIVPNGAEWRGKVRNGA